MTDIGGTFHCCGQTGAAAAAAADSLNKFVHPAHVLVHLAHLAGQQEQLLVMLLREIDQLRDQLGN
jgi:hypothetical protein